MVDPRRPLDIFQIEITNFCDMACPYCPHEAMTRPKGHMSAEILEKCIVHSKNVGRKSLILHHFGEPLLHPKLAERFLQVKEAGLGIQFSTNATLLDKKMEMLMSLETRIDVVVSVHQWRDQPVSTYWEALAAFQAKAKGSQVFIHNAYNVSKDRYFFCKWVNGRVRDWDYYKDCYFLRENSAVVLWNGDIASCCIDCHGESVFSNINMPGAFGTRTVAWRGCVSCDLGGRSTEALF